MSAAARILVTGASGFIGARLVEALGRHGHRVRVVTSDFRHCARVARFPVELVKADLLDPAGFARTADGCETIFHLAYRFGGSDAEQRQANVEGTRALAEAAIRHGVRRFVHFSSIAAYGPPADGDLTETSTRRRSRDGYSDAKQRIDELLAHLHRTRALPVTFVQPTIVYGPYGYTWTTRLLEQVVSGRVALPAGGSGLCNAVYVDDVVRAAILAAESDAAPGESFLISGATPVTWRSFYGAYERMTNRNAVVLMDDEQLRVEERRADAARALTRRLRNAVARRPDVRERLLGVAPVPWLLGAGRKVLPNTIRRPIARWYEKLWELPPRDTEPLYVPDAGTRRLYAAKTHVRIDKARDTLGFTPAFDLDGGMSKTNLWARWANLFPN